MTKGAAADRDQLRVLRFLSGGKARFAKPGKGDKLLLERDAGGAIAVAARAVRELEVSGALDADADAIALTGAGRARLRRLTAAHRDQAYQAQHRQIEKTRIRTGDGWETADLNLAESPLAMLSRRKTATGEPFLTEPELRAGERLRRDYAKGMIMTRTGVDWSSTGGASTGARSGNLAAELTDIALAARQRVEAAMEAVGPELSGILVDICCFLKGLERVERERGWPARSAKIVLKSALGVLGRHYEPARHDPPRRGRIVHWGGQDYRPQQR